MTIIHLVGPNAIGKTTAVRRWAARYNTMVPVSLDLLRKEGYDTAAEKSARCQEWREGKQVVVVESARTTQLLTVVSCDSESKGTVHQGEQRIEGFNWKGTQEEKERHVAEVRQRFPLSVCESARTTTTRYATPSDPVIIVTCPGPVLGKHLRARCEAKGKQFREDYWDQWKLEYESTRRYLNFAAKNLMKEQVRHFVIEDQARDWQAVDAYFGVLYRRLHNQLMGGR